MNNNEQEPPARTFTWEINIPVISLPPEIMTAFADCSAEAQMLEHAIKTAITKDVHVFANVGDQISFLEILEKVTLGQAKDIAMGTSQKKDGKKIAECIGFFEFVKMGWGFSGRSEPELCAYLKDVVARRNRLAHQLLAEVFYSALSIQDALKFMAESRERFIDARTLIVTADELSVKTGSIASDGSSLPRFKITA